MEERKKGGTEGQNKVENGRREGCREKGGRG